VADYPASTVVPFLSQVEDVVKLLMPNTPILQIGEPVFDDQKRLCFILGDKSKLMTVQSEFLRFRVKYPDIMAADVETKESRNYFSITYKVPKADANLSFRLDKEAMEKDIC
jgi:hypothetical protein